MEDYIVKKILNNNVVIAENNGKEFVLVGKAIGFNYGKGKKIPEGKIENKFVKQLNSDDGNFNRILNKIDSEIVGISEEIISLCEKRLKVKLNEAIHISLPDHINFAIRRNENGIEIKSPFLHELMALYPDEYRIAEKALDMINSRLDAELPEDEIGFICMHINAALKDQEVSASLAYTRKIGEIMELISKLLKKKFDKASIEYIRTVTHLSFVIERIMDKKTIKNNLLDNIKKDLYNEYSIAIKVALKIENLFSIKVPEDEIGYIALHLNRLLEI
ncbi:PRD domain-containing protein [Clostridium bovifaecis]|uniref:PRD domain-containing protein n=1 Tax=Clostridium bovifaecis TaxID=2184719 RepID=A0A6I6F2V1_9CLOT|nr:PRD domain-containing protein [Clostridium bovifaecis]